ncbi:centromere protein j-like [Limosa lapponica baueri]|uniref:Centromere protein j-like n=1 Tax=Limosa lapponica baueri TaxID=1758121 RepID=A0A2I0U651_LIMLA|nr:centromere protein j-like [Limosa lapponica baueri]
MEAYAFKEEDNMSQQTASDLASIVPTSKIIIEKFMPSLSPGQVDNMNESSGKQCPLLYSSEASSMMGNSNDSTDNLGHDQAFQHARQLCYLASCDCFPQKLASSVTQAGIHDASNTLEMFTPPLLPASEPGTNHCAPTYKNMEQSPGQQDQVMRQHMEQLQRLVAEQQKIIALYNPDNSQLRERTFPETFSAVNKEQREQVNEEILLSPFGIERKMKTGNVEGRPVTPALCFRQKPSEEFVEEQIIVDNHLIAKQQKEKQSKAKVTPRKAFLKRREGMVRLKKTKQKPLKEDSKHSRKAGLDCWSHFSQPVQVDAAELEIKAQTDCEAKVVEQSAEEKVIERDEASKENPVDSSQRRWPEILQPCPETVTEMNLQVGEEREAHHTDSVGKAGRTDERLVEGTLQKDLGRVDQPLKSHLIEGAKNPLEVLQKHSPLQDLEIDHTKEAEWSAGPAFTHGQKWVQVHPQELVLGSQSSESKRQIHTGFKMVNGKIVKIALSSTEAVEKGSSSSALQQERQRKGTAVLMWHVASLSCESSCLSSSSDDDPKSHDAQYVSQHGPQGVDHTDRHLDLSDGDYASDEPSGTEKMSIKTYNRSPPRKQDIQVMSRQCLSCSASSSDSSIGAVRLKGSKAHFSLQQSPFHLTRLKRREHEPKSKNENRARDVKSLDLPCSTGTGEIPAFKIKETPAVEEPQKKLFIDTLDVFIEETQNILTRGLETNVYHRGTPSGARVKEEPEKAMHFHRKQMDQLKTVRSQELTHPLEHYRDQIHPLQKEKIAHSKFKGTARVTGENVKAEEIQILKQQIAGLQEEFKRNESCWHAAYGKLRDQVEMLTRQNMELRDELRVSEHQRWKAEKNPEAVNFMDRKSETPVAEAILRETASSSKQEERSRRDNHKSHSISPVGPKTSLQKHFFRDANGKVVHQPSPTGRRTDDRKSPVAVSHLSGFKEPNSSSYVKGKSLPMSDSSEDMSLSHNHRNNTCSFVLCNNNEETEPPKSILSRKSVSHQERRKSEEEVQEKIEHRDGKVEEVLTDGRRIITFRNGTKKEISADKRMTTISFFNGDVKKIMPDQTVIYYYADAQTTHTAYPDGLEVLQFPNNQIEKHYPDGTQEIVFPDHTVKCLYSDGFKETFFPDGTVVKVEKNGDKTVVFSNGQKEVHTAQFKRREYPDGTVKTVYCNGRQETKYSTGRVRIKDEEGNIILDKK